MKALSVAIFLLAASFLRTVHGVLSVNATPAFIKPCRKDDPDINGCLKHAFDHLRPYLSKGIPEIKLQSIEPLKIPKMTMDNGNGAVRVRAQFNNITVYGATNYTIIDVKGNVTSYKLDLTLGIPRIEVTGSYDVNGNVLLFPVRSRGDFWAMFSNITGVGKIYGKEVVKSGIKFMKTEKLLVDFKLARSRFRIRDHLNGNNVIGEAMNQFLNQNANEIIEEMKPAAAAAIGKHFKAFLNGAFLQVPIPVWLKE
ncbi:circadian clock-controlled protein-like [Cimex lectularius]|uniref:Protein takeout n=1 Tax=Cimex lectularius TaxID=79782 RepID=A0A8I6RG44_CIMLE|nr:circadian clock-controlled protein-like [Cimex lectularius]